jgi:hypothetical protein
MPEAPIHEDGDPGSRKDDVGFAPQANDRSSMYPVTVTSTV